MNKLVALCQPRPPKFTGSGKDLRYVGMCPLFYSEIHFLLTLILWLILRHSFLQVCIYEEEHTCDFTLLFILLSPRRSNVHLWTEFINNTQILLMTPLWWDSSGTMTRPTTDRRFMKLVYPSLRMWLLFIHGLALPLNFTIGWYISKEKPSLSWKLEKKDNQYQSVLFAAWKKVWLKGVRNTRSGRKPQLQSAALVSTLGTESAALVAKNNNITLETCPQWSDRTMYCFYKLHPHQCLL